MNAEEEGVGDGEVWLEEEGDGGFEAEEDHEAEGAEVVRAGGCIGGTLRSTDPHRRQKVVDKGISPLLLLLRCAKLRPNQKGRYHPASPPDQTLRRDCFGVDAAEVGDILLSAFGALVIDDVDELFLRLELRLFLY